VTDDSQQTIGIDVMTLIPAEGQRDGDGTHRVSFGSDPSPRRLQLLAVVACLLVVAGAIAVVAKRNPGAEDGTARLAAAQAAVAAATSYRYEIRDTSTVQTGDPDGAGSEVTNRSVSTGTVAAADRWRVVEDSADAFFGDAGEPFEIVRLGDRVYSKGGFSDVPDGVEAPAWMESPAGEPLTMDDYLEMYEFMTDDTVAEDVGLDAFEVESDAAYDAQWRLDVLLGAYLLPIEVDPANLGRLIEDATDPVVEERLPDGGVRLRAVLAPIPGLEEIDGEAIEPVDLVLDLDKDDAPVAARFSVATDGASSIVEVSYSDWGADLVVDAPDPADVDQTPWVTEEALAAVDQDLLVAPTELPGSLALTGADVLEYDDDCWELDLSYSDPSESDIPFDLSDEEYSEAMADIPYLWVSVLSRACSEAMDESPFDAQVGGFPSRGDDGYVEVLVGDAVVTIDSDLDEAEVDALVASLRPTTAQALADAIPEWARQWSSAGWASMTSVG
jgi:hypothetical protein